MTRFYFIFLFFLLLSTCTIGQNSVFSRVFDTINGNETGKGLSLLSNKRYSIRSSGVLNPHSPEYKFIDYLLLIDSVGEKINFYNYYENFNAAPKQPDRTYYDTVYIFGANQSVLPHTWRIFKFNTSGDSLGIIEYNHLPDDRMVADAMYIKDEYIYLAGRYFIPGLIGQRY